MNLLFKDYFMIFLLQVILNLIFKKAHIQQLYALDIHCVSNILSILVILETLVTCFLSIRVL